MTSKVRTLSTRELNRALLARQCLLERAAAPIPRVLERIGGLQAQYAPAMYVGLWSRMENFARDDLTQALAQRKVAQGTLQRLTIHLVSARDYWPFALAVRDARRRLYLKVAQHGPEAEIEAAAVRLRDALRAGPLGQRGLDAVITPVHRNGAGIWLDLVRVPPSGTWERRRADVYAAAEEWLGPPDVTEGAAQELVVRRYLAGFGPATRAEIADWAGLPGTVVRRTLEGLELRRFRAEDGAELVDLPRAPLPDADVTAPVRFLPVWDATMLVHARRSQILPEAYRPLIFNIKTPHSVPTFLVDGSVAGTWRYEKGRIQIKEFAPLDRSARREVDAEAERLAGFHG